MSCFFCPKESGGVWKIDRKARAIAVAAAKKGFSVVITTKTGADGSEILEDYRSRDTVEKLFDIFKNENGNVTRLTDWSTRSACPEPIGDRGHPSQRILPDIKSAPICVICE